MDSLFGLIVGLAEKDGVSAINKLPGCWERQVGEHWWFAINGHKETIKCSHGSDVPPVNCYLEFNGWPAGLFDPYGGIICAGEAGNEEAFVEALKAEINRGN